MMIFMKRKVGPIKPTLEHSCNEYDRERGNGSITRVYYDIRFALDGMTFHSLNLTKNPKEAYRLSSMLKEKKIIPEIMMVLHYANSAKPKLEHISFEELEKIADSHEE